ncbi:hypothetical protein BT63DRAFT_440585 [Microthyrium microscopicum]|uniref:Uncharacterized protein n=1 Tax=Microthyrium microscopicum TaxID=703497 RepID=A0A6A6UBV9_9PEZI|nr:hypothetical protein BT63DRAFT_440585 [Microthyrium microscopicum]
MNPHNNQPPAFPNQQPSSNQQQNPATSPTPTYDSNFADTLTAAILTPDRPVPPSQIPTNPSGPVPLSSSERVYPSSLNESIRLTHPHGSLLGGPGPVPAADLRAYAQDVAEVHGLKSQQELEAWARKGLARAGEDVSKVLQERERYIEHNERNQKKISELLEEREMEEKVAARLRAKWARKKQQPSQNQQ